MSAPNLAWTEMGSWFVCELDGRWQASYTDVNDDMHDMERTFDSVGEAIEHGIRWAQQRGLILACSAFSFPLRKPHHQGDLEQVDD